MAGPVVLILGGPMWEVVGRQGGDVSVAGRGIISVGIAIENCLRYVFTATKWATRRPTIES